MNARMSQQMALMTSQSTDDCYTPGWIVERVRQALGGAIDLDPASCETANRIVQARRFYTQDEDGYTRDWRSPALWLNPPFSDTPRWVRRLTAAYADGDVTAAVLLVNSAPGYEWWQALTDATPSVMLRRRLTFIKANGEPYPDHHKKGQTVAYFGPDLRAFLTAFGDLGRVLLPPLWLTELAQRLDALRDQLCEAKKAPGADWAWLGNAAGIAGLAAGSARKASGDWGPAWSEPLWEVDRDAA